MAQGFTGVTELSIGNVTAASNITANSVVIGDDGARAVKLSTMFVSDAGEMTNSSQPAFLAILGTTDSNVTGDNSAFTLGSGNALTEKFDQNADFNTNGTFTAPVTGKYFFSFNISYLLQGATTGLLMRLTTSNDTYSISDCDPTNVASASNRVGLTNSIVCDMDASDTTTFIILGSGGTKVDDIGGTSTFERTYICGNLAC